MRESIDYVTVLLSLRLQLHKAVVAIHHPLTIPNLSQSIRLRRVLKLVLNPRMERLSSSGEIARFDQSGRKNWKNSEVSEVIRGSIDIG